MMVTEKEKTTIRSFICAQLRDGPDLSTLTLGILKKRYLAHMRFDSLASEAKCFMKQVVEEELMKMQDNHDSGKWKESKRPQNKRKRGKENDGGINGTKDESESRAKKSRRYLSSSSDSDDKEVSKPVRKAGEADKEIASGSEDEDQGVKKSQRKINKKSKPQIDSEGSNEDSDVSGKKEIEREDSDSDSQKEEDKKKENTTENGKTRSSDTNKGNKTPQSEEEDESDSESKSAKTNKVKQNDSSDESEKEAKASVKKENNKSDSDSSSLPSLEDEPDVGGEKKKDNKKKRNVKKEKESDSDSTSQKTDRVKQNDSSDESEKEAKAPVKKGDNDSDSDSSSLPSLEDGPNDGGEEKKDNKKKMKVKKEKKERSQKDEDRAVTRLKRFITMCGARRNYKKLLDGCRSVRSQVAVLKKELEELGVHGQPSIKKCKKARIKREQAQELAELDTNNIITTKGRPKRRGAWQEPQSPAPSPHARPLSSSSESDEENNKRRGGRRATDWDNLKGIISDDADSD